jgi:hypothetical protein
MSAWIKAARHERAGLLSVPPSAAPSLRTAQSGDLELLAVAGATARAAGGDARAPPQRASSLRVLSEDEEAAKSGGSGAPLLPSGRAPGLYSQARGSPGGGPGGGAYDASLFDRAGKAGAWADGALADRVEAVGGVCSAARCCLCLPCCASLSLRTRWLVSVLVATLLAAAASAGAVFAAPLIVRDRIAATTLTFSAIELTAPTGGPGAAGAAGFTITASAVLAGLAPIGGTLEAMPVQLLFEGAPLAAFTLPELSALPYVDNALQLSAPVRVTDLAAFDRFGVALLRSPTVSFTLTGSATVRAGALRVAGVPFDKAVTVAGANNLAENYVSSFSLARSTPTAALVNLTVVAQNPSVATIAPLGDLAVDVFYGGAYFGTVVAANASLAAGENTLTFVGQLASADLPLTNALISSYLGGVAVNVTAVGSTRVPATIPLYADLLRNVSISTQLVGGDVPLVSSVAVHSMELAPRGLDAVRVGLNATIFVNNILGPDSPLRLTSVRVNVTLLGSGKPLGRLVVDMPDFGADAPLAAAAAPPPPRRLLAAGAAPALPTIAIPLVLDAELDITESVDAFAEFILDFLSSKTVALGLFSAEATGLEANISCALGNLTIGIPLDIVAPVAGLDGFPYVAVDSFAVTGEVLSPETAVLVALNVTVLNPSPATFSLGARSVLGIFAGDVRLGSSVAYNATLAPGYNTLSLTGKLAPPTSALPAASALFSDYLNGVDAVVTVRGEDVDVGGGALTPPWLLAAVQSIRLAATLPAVVGLKVFDDVQLRSLDLEWAPPPGGGDPVPYVAGVVEGNIHLPFSIPVDIPGYSLVLVFNDPASGAPMARVTLDDQRAEYTPALLQRRLPPALGNAPVVGRLTLFLDRSPLDVLDEPAFAAFLATALLSPSAAVVLTGTAAPVVNIAIGSLNITGVRIAENLTLPGINGLSDPPPVILAVDVAATTPDTVTLSVTLNITNPSVIAGALGPVRLALAYGGAVVATADVDDLVVARGVNVVVAQGLFVLPDPKVDPAGYARKTAFLGGYLSGVDATLRLLGGAFPASPYPLLQPALAALNTSCPFPGLDRRIVTNGTLYIDLSNPLLNPPPPRPNGTLFLDNPLSVDIVLVDAALTVFLCNEPLANGTACGTAPAYNDPIGFFYDGDLSLRPARATARSVSRSPVYPIKLLAADNLGDEIIILYDVGVFGDIVTKMNGTVTVRVGDFTIALFFEQYALPLFVDLPANTPPF